MKEYKLNPVKITPPLTDTDKMPFGAHAGKLMESVPADYCLWLWNENVQHHGVRGYIITNFDALVQECPDKIVTPPTDAERKLYK
jgi:uncharacterized protein (DUF3820 family)